MCSVILHERNLSQTEIHGNGDCIVFMFFFFDYKCLWLFTIHYTGSSITFHNNSSSSNSFDQTVDDRWLSSIQCQQHVTHIVNSFLSCMSCIRSMFISTYLTMIWVDSANVDQQGSLDIDTCCWEYWIYNSFYQLPIKQHFKWSQSMLYPTWIVIYCAACQWVDTF